MTAHFPKQKQSRYQTTRSKSRKQTAPSAEWARHVHRSSLSPGAGVCGGSLVRRRAGSLQHQDSTQRTKAVSAAVSAGTIISTSMAVLDRRVTAQGNAFDCSLGQKGGASLLWWTRQSTPFYFLCIPAQSLLYRSAQASLLLHSIRCFDAKPRRFINSFVLALSLALPPARVLVRLVCTATPLSSSFPASNTSASRTSPWSPPRATSIAYSGDGSGPAFARYASSRRQLFPSDLTSSPGPSIGRRNLATVSVDSSYSNLTPFSSTSLTPNTHHHSTICYNILLYCR